MMGIGEKASPIPFTIFTAPKPHTDEAVARRQRRAIMSWAVLDPSPEVLIFGDDDGVTDLRRELGLRSVPNPVVGDTGIPILSDLFAAAERTASHGHLCYVNSDIVLFDDFPSACTEAWTWQPDAVLVGSRCDVDDYIDGSSTAADRWSTGARAKAADGQVCMGTDFCGYSRGTFSTMPPFAIGRTAFDNWLMWQARREGLPLVDLSEAVTALHVRHRVPGEWESLMATPEVARNRHLATLWQRTFTVADCSHRLTPKGVRARPSAALRHRCGIVLRIVESRLRGERWF